MSILVDFQGEAEVHAMLAKWMEPQLSKRAQRAAKKGANVLKAPLKAAAGRLSKRMAASVYVHVAKRDRPAYVVGHHRKKAFFWHMVIGGTKAHSLSPRKAAKRTRASYPFVRGVQPHPIVAEVAQRYQAQAYQAMISDLSKED
jgi:hypothetical protein